MRPFVSCHCLILKKASGAHRHYLDGIFCLLTQTDSVTAPAWKVPLPSSRLDSRRRRSPPSPLPRWACGGVSEGTCSLSHIYTTHTHTIRALCPPFHTWPFSPPHPSGYVIVSTQASSFNNYPRGCEGSAGVLCTVQRLRGRKSVAPPVDTANSCSNKHL